MEPAPFHSGERDAQSRAGFTVERAPIRNFMPNQHRAFFAARPFLLIAGMADDGALAATVLAGLPGFLSSPDARSLHVEAASRQDDPFFALMTPGLPVGALGIDFATRRRNRVNGRMGAVTASGFAIDVEQSFGNCPKYIQPREIEPMFWSSLRLSNSVERLAGLDDAARRLMGEADTFFVASSSGPAPLEHGGVDVSHRGGPPGFVRVDGDRLIVPDFSGNRYFNTLGNFLRHPWAALLFIDFATGDLLHLSGLVALDWRPAEDHEGAARSWRLDVQAGWRRRAAKRLG
jgi:uncharacterized protein